MKYLRVENICVVTVMAASFLGAADVSQAGNWPGWRGPTGMGYTDEKDLPLRWDGKTKDNLLWKMPLGGIGNSSPIVWQDRVFVTVSRKQTNKDQDDKIIPDHWVTCFQTDGKELWRTQVPAGHYPRGYGIYAVPTPVTDGERIYCWFSSGVMAALDFAGKVVWRTELPGELPKRFDGMINSPLLFQDTVIRVVNADQAGGNGVLQALEKATGKVKWDKKLAKSGSANASPLLLPINGKLQLIVAAGNNLLEAVDPANGASIWSFKRRMGDLSPVYASGLLFTDCPGGPGLAIDPNGQGDITKTNEKWKIDKTPASYAYASPGICGDYIYRVHKPGILHCWRLSTGELLYAERVEGLTNLASPISTADNRVYFVTSSTSHVLKAGPKLEILATNNLGGYNGNNGPSPAVSNGRIYVRDAAPAGGEAYLYCLGAKQNGPAAIK